MTYRLFLDDERFPADDGYDWVIVRTGEAAIKYVCENGFPSFVSFDHDLGDGITGKDVAKWLIERDLDHSDMPDDFDFTVHSQNPVGAKNIEMTLGRYIRYRNEGI